MKKRVYIVDDHALFSQSLSVLINHFEAYEVTFQGQNGRDLIFRLQDGTFEAPDIILLDLNMPVMNGVETMDWLMKNHPAIPVLVLSMQDDANLILEMIKKGVKGYEGERTLCKSSHVCRATGALNWHMVVRSSNRLHLRLWAWPYIFIFPKEFGEPLLLRCSMSELSPRCPSEQSDGPPVGLFACLTSCLFDRKTDGLFARPTRRMDTCMAGCSRGQLPTR